MSKFLVNYFSLLFFISMERTLFITMGISQPYLLASLNEQRLSIFLCILVIRSKSNCSSPESIPRHKSRGSPSPPQMV